jgi:hypothetical protein
MITVVFNWEKLDSLEKLARVELPSRYPFSVGHPTTISLETPSNLLKAEPSVCKSQSACVLSTSMCLTLVVGFVTVVKLPNSTLKDVTHQTIEKPNEINSDEITLNLTAQSCTYPLMLTKLSPKEGKQLVNSSRHTC